MAIESPERELENLRKQLSVAVRSVQWSYAIFWSLSTTKQGVLEWGDGYYNGDVKTRKTVPAAEVYADKLGLRRSEQLRELYESLLEGDSEIENTNTRPAATLCPEDLSDLEWYYLVCMSFTFKIGQSLPGRAFASGQSVWLCNAQEADSKLFTRSLLAKSASVKTVICFPHMGGVIELGVTDVISEDPKLIQHIKTSLLEFAKPVCAEKSSSDQKNTDYDKDQTGAKITEMSQEMLEPEAFVNLYPAAEGIKLHEEVVNELHKSMAEELNNRGSPDDCSNEYCGNNQQTEDSFMLEANGIDIVDDEDYDDDDLSHCIQDSFNSSGCISQAFISSKDNNTNNRLHLEKIQDCNDTKFSSLDLGNNNDDEDLHYKRIVAAILQSSHFLVKGQSVCSYGNRFSSFVPWKKAFVTSRHSPQPPQKTLKKILFTVPLMIATCPLDHPNKDGEGPKAREENDKYLVLRSLVPSINKVDKTSILNDTVEYLKELEARVEELESCIYQSDCEVKARRKYADVAEQTSDNYHTKSRSDPKKTWANKRKACDIDENDPELELGKVVPFDNKGPLDMTVMIKEQEVLIEMRCPWREYLLLDIMDAVNNLCLDAHTVQSSTVDGVLIVTLKSKFRGAAFASAGMIKQALRKMVGIC